MERLSITGQIVVSIIVLGMLAIDGGLVLTTAIPAGSEKVADILMGGLITLSTIVVQWWLGSSHSSMAKSATIDKAVEALAVSTPPA